MAKKFVRTKVPTVERLISVAIVVLLVGVGAAIAVKGQRFDPNRYSLDPELLASTREVQPDANAGLRGPGAGLVKVAAGPEMAGGETGYSEEGYAYSEGASPAGGGKSAGEIELKVNGLTPSGATEVFNSENLYEKINGQAEGYRVFNFQQLRCRTFTLADGSYVDIFEYNMGDPINAYGIFSAERGAGAPAIDFVADGYRDEMGFFFRQANCYIQVRASDTKPATVAAAEQAARAMAASIEADDKGLAGLKSLPQEELDRKTISFTPADAFGIPGLVDVFQATYQVNAKPVTFFISTQPDDATAAKIFNSFKELSGQFGKVGDEAAVGDAQLFNAESFGQFKVIYRRGAQIGGVVDAENVEAAREFVKSHLERKP